MKVNNIVNGIATVVALSIFAFSCEKPTNPNGPTDEIKGIEESYSRLKIENGKVAPIFEEQEREIKEQFIKYTSRYKSARDVSGGYDVGVIPIVAGCPLNSELVKVLADAEDDTPHDSYTSGNAVSWYKDGGGDVIMYYCKVDGRLLAAASGYFTVIRFCPGVPTSTIAPLSSIQQSHLTFDTENGGHTRWIAPTTAEIAAPNIIDGNNNLAFHLLSYNNPGTVAMPDYGFSYAVLGGYAYGASEPSYYSLNKFGTGTAYRGLWYVDTEDNSNNDSWSFDAGPAPQLWIKKTANLIYNNNGTGSQRKGIDLYYAIVR